MALEDFKSQMTYNLHCPRTPHNTYDPHFVLSLNTTHAVASVWPRCCFSYCKGHRQRSCYYDTGDSSGLRGDWVAGPGGLAAFSQSSGVGLNPSKSLPDEQKSTRHFLRSSPIRVSSPLPLHIYKYSHLMLYANLISHSVPSGSAAPGSCDTSW